MKMRKVVRKVFCNFGFGGAWMPLLYLNEGHAVSCDSYPRKTAKTIFARSNHTSEKLPKPFYLLKSYPRKNDKTIFD